MTLDEIRRTKPTVRASLDGKEISGKVLNSRKGCGLVMVNVGGERRCLEFTWEAIERAVNHGEVLIA